VTAVEASEQIRERPRSAERAERGLAKRRRVAPDGLVPVRACYLLQRQPGARGEASLEEAPALAGEPLPDRGRVVGRERAEELRGEGLGLVLVLHADHPSSPVRSTARKASCGISTWPTIFMRFLPAFCFSSSLRLRVMSPP